jgi:hypothetical protein
MPLCLSLLVPFVVCLASDAQWDPRTAQSIIKEKKEAKGEKIAKRLLFSTLGSTRAKKRAFAVCLVGAARSMDNLGIVNSLHANVIRPLEAVGGADLFFHVHVGKELSERGQDAVSPERAESMANALQNATQFRFQYQENDFTCGQMATGKFWKVSQCAHMVMNYSRTTGTKYDCFLLLRPDWYVRKIEFKKILRMQRRRDRHQRESTWIKVQTKFVCDCTVADYTPGILAASTLDRAACCNIEKREPSECFINGLQEPDANFLFRRHFMGDTSEVRAWAGGWVYAMGNLVRINKTLAIIAQAKKEKKSSWAKALHGKYRQDVGRHERPRMSEVITWMEGTTATDRATLVRELLSRR